MSGTLDSGASSVVTPPALVLTSQVQGVQSGRIEIAFHHQENAGIGRGPVIVRPAGNAGQLGANRTRLERGGDVFDGRRGAKRRAEVDGNTGIIDRRTEGSGKDGRRKDE
jgi:hypothetical protein